MVLQRILRCFQLTSGLEVNLSKSILVGVGCTDNDLQPMADLLHCGMRRLSCQYLGQPIGTDPRSKVLRYQVIEKFENKLSSLKRQYSSMETRILLIKANISNSPMYYMPHRGRFCLMIGFG